MFGKNTRIFVLFVAILLSACNLKLPPPALTCGTARTPMELAKLGCWGEIVTVAKNDTFSPSLNGKTFGEFRLSEANEGQATIDFTTGSSQPLNRGSLIVANSFIVAHVLEVLPNAIIVFVPFGTGIGWVQSHGFVPYGISNLRASAEEVKGKPVKVLALRLDQCFSSPFNKTRGFNTLGHVDSGFVNFNKTVGPTLVGDPVFVKAHDGSQSQVAILLEAHQDRADLQQTQAIVFWMPGRAFDDCEVG